MLSLLCCRVWAFPSVWIFFVSVHVSRVTTAPSAVLQACTGPIAPRPAPATTRSPARTSTAPASAEKVQRAQKCVLFYSFCLISILCFLSAAVILQTAVRPWNRAAFLLFLPPLWKNNPLKSGLFHHLDFCNSLLVFLILSFRAANISRLLD